MTKRKPPDVRQSKRMKEVRQQMQSLESQLKVLRQEQDNILSGQRVLCPSCGKTHPVKELLYIQGQRYHKSYSSYEDSYWDLSGKTYTICPNCASMLKFLDQDWCNLFRPYFMKLHKGSLEYRPGYEDNTRREGRISLMIDRRLCSGYDEVLLTPLQLSKATKGVIPGVQYP